MANRFPLIVDSDGVPLVKELPSGDNLNLTGSNIVNSGSIATTTLSINGVNTKPVSASTLSELSNVHTASPAVGQALVWDNSNSRWAPANTGGASGGRWTKIGNSQTVSSQVYSLEFTGFSGYDEYEIRWQNGTVGNSSDSRAMYIVCDYGSGYEEENNSYRYLLGGDTSASGGFGYGTGGRANIGYWPHDSSNGGDPDLAPVHGRLHFTSTSSAMWFECKYDQADYVNKGMRAYGSIANINFEQSTITKVKFTTGQTSGANGIKSGTFTLYGLNY